ncbi:MAG: SAM-dependent methyltransferase [Peptococcaceae bacterium]|nr:SAM-dependent methyltransferase [Peptococcaceae bacterium]
MDLSLRLGTIANLVPQGSRVADIGTDHGMLPLSLLKRGIASHIIASDVTEKTYQGALLQIRLADVQTQIQVRKGDGLEVLAPGEVNVIIIAGMGGITISGILERGKEVLDQTETLLLQPMTDPAILRTWLSKNSWKLIEEELIKEEGKFYIVIKAVPGEEECTDDFSLEIGPLLIKKNSPILLEYLEKRAREYKKILRGLSKSRSKDSIHKEVDVKKTLERLREVIDKCSRTIS